MRKATRISLALSTSAALLTLAAVPASAAELDSDATIEVEAGVLGIAVNPTLELATLTPGATATLAVPGVAVTDNRAGLIGWNVAVEMTDFEALDVPESTPIPAAGASYVPGVLGSTGTIHGLASTGVTWASAGEVLAPVTTSTVHGNNTASWDATLSVPVPDDALAGEYSAVLTHSVI